MFRARTTITAPTKSPQPKSRKTSNAEHPTSNAQPGAVRGSLGSSMFGVRCWMFDVLKQKTFTVRDKIERGLERPGDLIILGFRVLKL